MAQNRYFEADGFRFSINPDGKSVTLSGLINKNTQKIVIPSTVNNYPVTAIGPEAFSYCSGLTSVTIPASVTSIGISPFSRCTGLISFKVASDNPIYDSRDNCNAIIETATKTLICGCKSTVIPDSVTSIGEDAFSGCTGLKSVTIPDSVTEIGDGAFSGCTGLTSVTIGNSVKTIAPSAFEGCTGLKSVTIPNSVTEIWGQAFEGCTGLKSVTIGNSVTSIGDWAFSRCSSLTSVCIGNSVTSIGDLAFSRCYSLTRVTIPDSVIIIGDWAFRDTAWFVNQPYGLVYAGLVAYKYKGTMPSDTSIVLKDGTKGIAVGAFRGCTGLTSVTIPDSVTKIGEGAFIGCTGLTSVTIPDSVTSIGHGAFKGCTGLTSVTIPESVKTIGRWAFDGCTGLKSVTIPNSVTSIGTGAFRGCTGLKQIILTGFGHNSKVLPEEIQKQIELLRIGSGISEIGDIRCNPKEIRCYAEVPPRCSEGVFTGFDAVLHVPERAAAAYFEADVWRNFTNIVFDADEN